MRVPKLKLPLWQDIVYLVFVALIPIVLTAIELFGSSSSLFKWSFASVGSIFITYAVIRRFILVNKIKELKSKCVMLEHDYSIEVGNKRYIEYQWKKYNFYLYLYNAINMLLVVILTYIFISALTTNLIAFRGASTLILASVLVGLIFKVITFAISIKSEETDESDE